jgi:hypothetical protein
MKYLLLIYNDDTLVDALPAGRGDAMMRDCFNHADELRGQGHLLESQQLEAPATAKTVRIRNGHTSIVDGPFAETKEMLGGYNIIEAQNLDEAVRIAAEFPWTETGCVEIRPIRDIAAVRLRVGVGEQPT